MIGDRGNPRESQGRRRRVMAACALSLLAALATAQDAADLLPPLEPWEGSSRELALAGDHPWATPAERSGLRRTPSYDETVAWLEGLVAAADELEMVSIGKSWEGRQIWMVVASADGAFTPEDLRAGGKPTLLAHGGIHSGEIDGKDAGLMLLRDLTVLGTHRRLLERANLLFVPILNVDGHERSSRWGRMNQRGPEEMGWRTNARNQNLNRDFAKLDTPEVRALVRALDTWSPDLWADLHVTDGLDYQYDITFGFNGSFAWSPAVGGWLEERLEPALGNDLAAAGHIPGPLIFAVDRQDLDRGIFAWTAGPRYSNGYADARHLPGFLVENHSLKPYDQRVLGTRVLLASTLAVLGEHGVDLRRAVAADRARRPAEVPLSWQAAEGEPEETIDFQGIKQRRRPSAVSGGERVEWTGKPMSRRLPVVRQNQVGLTASRPAAYWIPPAWPEVVERLDVHGIGYERLAAPRTLEVEMYRLQEVALATEPFEGRVRVTARVEPERRREVFPVGSVRVPTDQPLGDLAVLLLEPESPDSFFSWGFFLEVLQRTEYFESYVMEPLAARMLMEDPKLAAEFAAQVEADEAFAADPRERLMWFYERTPYFDQRWRLYPVAREPSAQN